MSIFLGQMQTPTTIGSLTIDNETPNAASHPDRGSRRSARLRSNPSPQRFEQGPAYFALEGDKSSVAHETENTARPRITMVARTRATVKELVVNSAF
jgi:hypothetical protein